MSFICRDAMSEAKEQIEKILTEERVPEFEFGAIYSTTIVEIIDRGVLVQLHPEMQPVLIPNSQLDAKKVNENFPLAFTVSTVISPPSHSTLTYVRLKPILVVDRYQRLWCRLTPFRVLLSLNLPFKNT